jgi:hypothetical protein
MDSRVHSGNPISLITPSFIGGSCADIEAHLVSLLRAYTRPTPQNASRKPLSLQNDFSLKR